MVVKLLPKNIAVECEEISKCQGELFFEESIYIRHAIDKRKKEFIAGRVCARKALSQLGFSSCSIPIGTMRDPIWPSGVSGSISHDNDLCIAVAVKKEIYSSIGVDITIKESLDRDIADLICTNEDFRNISKMRLSDLEFDPFKLVFSIKESVYKCLFPIVHEIFDFQDVSVLIDPTTNSASINIHNKRLIKMMSYKFESKFCSLDQYIISVVWILAPV